MAEKIFVAVKPKYPTRKAIDKVLVKNEEGFIDIAEVNVPRQVIALLDTAHVAIVKDDNTCFSKSGIKAIYQLVY